MQDLFYALRLMRRTPGVAATAIASLALGIGVNALVFSVVNGLVLRPLPGVSDPDRFVFLQNGQIVGQSYPNYVDLRDRSTGFDSLAAYRIAPMSVETGAAVSGQPRRAWGYLATGSYFDTLGVKPALGRFFHAQDDRNQGEPAASRSAVPHSPRCWHQRRWRCPGRPGGAGSPTARPPGICWCWPAIWSPGWP